MALPYPTDPATPSLPNPYFQDNGFVRGDQQRSNNAQAWADMQNLDDRLVPVEAAITALTRYFYDGLRISNNAVTPDTKIDIAAGRASDSTFAVPIVLAGAITKDLSAAWAVGTENGGLDTGAIAPSTWYYPFLILRSDTGVVDVLFSASSSAPSMPANYNYHRRLRGAFRTFSDSKIIQFNQSVDGWVYWSNSSGVGTNNAVFSDFADTNPGTSAVLKTMTFPPLGVRGVVRVEYKSPNAAGVILYFSPTAVKDQAASGTTGQMNAITALLTIMAEIPVEIDTSSQLRYRLSNSDGNTIVTGVPVCWLESLS